MSDKQDKTYLGDSVYVRFTGWNFELTTENGLPNDPSNLIYLEPEVMAALMKFWQAVLKTDNLND